MKVSVIICAYNREDHILKTVNSLKDQTVNYNAYEVIIIDNNSSDKTGMLCKHYISSEKELTTRYFLEPKQGLSSARNRGIKESKNDIIAFIDDDAVVTSNYIESILKAYTDYPQVNALGGKVIPVFPDGKEPQWMSKHLNGVLAKVDIGEEIKEFTKKYPVGCNMTFRKEVFKQYGFFNEDITYRGDEKFMFLKLKKNNEKILYYPSIEVYHTMYMNRLTQDGIRKISLAIGYSEKLRLKDASAQAKIQKFAEYLIKLGGAGVIGFSYLLKGKPVKSKYLVRMMYFTMVGYIR